MSAEKCGDPRKAKTRMSLRSSGLRLLDQTSTVARAQQYAGTVVQGLRDYGDSALNSAHASAKRNVGVVEEGPRAAIAALGHMVRMIGDHDNGNEGHVARCAKMRRGTAIKCIVS